jgi:hypothetical protein
MLFAFSLSLAKFYQPNTALKYIKLPMTHLKIYSIMFEKVSESVVMMKSLNFLRQETSFLLRNFLEIYFQFDNRLKVGIWLSNNQRFLENTFS